MDMRAEGPSHHITLTRRGEKPTITTKFARCLLSTTLPRVEVGPSLLGPGPISPFKTYEFGLPDTVVSIDVLQSPGVDAWLQAHRLEEMVLGLWVGGVESSRYLMWIIDLQYGGGMIGIVLRGRPEDGQDA